MLGSLRIAAVRLSDDGQTLTLATDPHPRLARYLLPVPGTGNLASNAAASGGVGYDLTGVESTWTEEPLPEDHPPWVTWWPALDFDAVTAATLGSKPHDADRTRLARPGRLVLGTFARLPRGNVTVHIESSQPIEEVLAGDAQAEPTAPAPPGGTYRAVLTVPSQGDRLFLSITCRTGANRRKFALKATYRADGDKTEHAFERGQLIVPWAPLPTAEASAPLVIPDLAGGDPARGQAIFGGDKARCSQCHAFRGQGGKVGPDLTAIGKKGRAEIYRAIAAPSASIEPEFLSYSVASRDGQVVVGVVRAEGPDAIRVTDTNAHVTTIKRAQIEQIRASANSIMPVGLTGSLGEAAVRNLVAFLTTDSPPPAGATAPASPPS